MKIIDDRVLNVTEIITAVKQIIPDVEKNIDEKSQELIRKIAIRGLIDNIQDDYIKKTLSFFLKREIYCIVFDGQFAQHHDISVCFLSNFMGDYFKQLAIESSCYRKYLKDIVSDIINTNITSFLNAIFKKDVDQSLKATWITRLLLNCREECVESIIDKIKDIDDLKDRVIDNIINYFSQDKNHACDLWATKDIIYSLIDKYNLDKKEILDKIHPWLSVLMIKDSKIKSDEVNIESISKRLIYENIIHEDKAISSGVKKDLLQKICSITEQYLRKKQCDIVSFECIIKELMYSIIKELNHLEREMFFTACEIKYICYIGDTFEDMNKDVIVNKLNTLTHDELRHVLLLWPEAIKYISKDKNRIGINNIIFIINYYKDINHELLYRVLDQMNKSDLSAIINSCVFINKDIYTKYVSKLDDDSIINVICYNHELDIDSKIILYNCLSKESKVLCMLKCKPDVSLNILDRLRDKNNWEEKFEIVLRGIIKNKNYELAETVSCLTINEIIPGYKELIDKCTDKIDRDLILTSLMNITENTFVKRIIDRVQFISFFSCPDDNYNFILA
ncbi:MAG: hypothetical protein NZM04_03970 [Methylacidiphilales bacterium]|nr:hypothetical protein [Candidatus Methylacidiphilales bacterium]